MLIDFEEYRIYLRRTEKSDNTIKNYRIALEQLNNFCIENNFDELTIDAVLDFKKFMINEKKYTVKTLNNKIVVLNTYFNWKFQTKQSDLNLNFEKVQDESYNEFITESEFKRLIKACDNKEIELFIYTIANTGLRITEVCNLKKSDLFITTTEIKNKAKTRYIGMPAWLKKQLKAFTENLNDDDPIFSRKQDYYRRHLKSLASAARVKKTKVYPHAFRHYYAKQFLEKNGGEKSLSKLKRIMGHSSIETTMIYLNYSDDEIAREMAKSSNR